MDEKDDLISRLIEENRLLRARIAELEKRLTKNSQNSSKPPSSDGFKKQPRFNTKSLREQGKLPSGGQAGHIGDTLKQVAHPDKTIIHTLSNCPHCALDLKNSAVDGLVKRQVFDIPFPKIEVTEHQVELKYCGGCERTVQAPFPPEVTAPVQYGTHVRSYSVYFNQAQLIPEDRLQQLFADIFKLPISTATLVSFGVGLSKTLQPFMSSVLQSIKIASRKHLDETGFRISGQTQWLHVASNDAVTYYHISPKRKSLLSTLKGIVCHDHWKPYYQLKHVKHALCNAHHIRELNALIEYEHEVWAKKMKRLLYFALKWKMHHQGYIPKDEQKRLFILYNKIIKEGLKYHESLPDYGSKPTRGRPAHRTGYNLLTRLSHYRADVLRFVTVPDVPFSNNQAEQDIRMMKVKQKISGGFRTTEGAEVFITIRSFISTMRKQGRNIFDSLAAAVAGNVPTVA